MSKTPDQILQEQKSRQRLNLTVLAALSVAAVVLVFAKQVMGWVFLVMALLMGAAMFLRLRNYRQALEKLGDRDAFARQIREADSLQLEAFGLTLTKDFAVLERPSFQVYRLEEMAKFEVGLAGDAKKVLFLTDRQGERHAIAETAKGDDNQSAFDRAYRWVRDYFHTRTQTEREEKNT
jgi:hypothetical protein